MNDKIRDFLPKRAKEFITGRKKILISIFVFVLLILIFLQSSFVREFSAWEDNPFSRSRINILLAGYDIDHHGLRRTDTLMVASIDTSREEFNIISIPRDSRTMIPGHGMNRINSAYAFGGIDLTIETVERFLRLPIDYYVVVDFDGFIDIVDAMGGVELEIEERMHYVDRAGNLHINFDPGKKTLSGQEALKYVRYRDEVLGDIGRIQRQQKFITAAIEQLFTPGQIMDIPGIVNETLESIYTDIPKSDFLPFLRTLMVLDLERLNTGKIPGSPEYIGGASYWIPDEDGVQEMTNQFLRGEEQRRHAEIKLEIYNGNGVSGSAGRAANKFRRYGFSIQRAANADHFNYDENRIIYYDRENEETARRIRSFLEGELKHREVVESNNDRDNVIEIILGQDFIEQFGLEND